MGRYSLKNELSLQDFKLMEKMEAHYYNPEYITPAVEAYQWHRHNPYTGIVLAEGKNIVGFLDILPVSHETCLKIMAGKFNDKDMKTEDVLTPEEMMSKDHQPISLFVSCAVVHPDYRGKGVTAHLLREYLKQLNQMVSWGIEFEKVVGDCVTFEGERFSQKIGMKYLTASDHGTKIYTGLFSEFVTRITSLTKVEE